MSAGEERGAPKPILRRFDDGFEFSKSRYHNCVILNQSYRPILREVERVDNGSKYDGGRMGPTFDRKCETNRFRRNPQHVGHRLHVDRSLELPVSSLSPCRPYSSTIGDF